MCVYVCVGTGTFPHFLQCYKIGEEILACLVVDRKTDASVIIECLKNPLKFLS